MYNKDNLNSYRTWLKFKNNKDFYRLYSSLFLFFAYESEETLAEQIKGFSYLYKNGNTMFTQMLLYMFANNIISPLDSNIHEIPTDFDFKIKVNIPFEEVYAMF